MSQNTTGPARMTPKREAALRDGHYPRFDGEGCFCAACLVRWPCDLTQALDALAAERAHAQQVEVLHSSAAVLGYVAVLPRSDGTWFASNIGMQPTLEAITDRFAASADVIQAAAVVRVGADGRIGGPA